MAASFAQPRWTRRFWWLAVAVAAVVALTQAVRSGGDAQAELPVVAPQEPINQVDARLLADGWIANPDRDPRPFERQRAHNNLASLSACSGTGMDLILENVTYLDTSLRHKVLLISHTTKLGQLKLLWKFRLITK